MFWKGDEVSQVWKQQPNYEYHQFTKLDPKNPNDKAIIKSYWLQEEQAEGLSHYDSEKLI